MLLFYLLELGRITAGRLPAIISYPLAGFVGDIVYYVWPRGARNLAASIAAVIRRDIHSHEVKKTARYAMRNFCKYIVDMLRYAYPKKGVFERDIDLVGTENIEKALNRGKGAIIVGFHMGNLDLGIRALSHAGYPIHAIVQDLESGQTNRFVQKPRAQSGLKLLSASNGILEMIHVLKRNEIVALMIDSPGHEKGITVKLANKDVTLPGGMAAMAIRTGAAVLPCGLVRSTNTKFLGIVGKAVQLQPSGDLMEDAREITQRTVSVLEEMARLFPDQWYIFHPLIKDSVEENAAGSEPLSTQKTGEVNLAH